MIKRIKQYLNMLVVALLLSTILCSTYSSAVSAEFNKNVRVDSNSWTKMASPTKATSNHYAAIYLRNMMDVNHSSNNNYEQLLARMSQNHTTVIQKQVAGKGSYSGGIATLKRGCKSVYLLKDEYRHKDKQINIFLKGHNPKYDCYVSGSWNVDRADAEL